MGFFDNLFKRKKRNELEDIFPGLSTTTEPAVGSKVTAPEESYTFPEGTIMSFDDEVLDVESPENIAKLKHNMRILMEQAKQKGRVDNFFLIREDDFFPTNWEWNVLSDQTNLEPIVTSLSFEIRKAIALEEAGIKPYVEVMGMQIPNSVTFEEEQAALSKVAKNVGAFLIPSHFRSTKHFTVNTPLGVTGDYNAVKTGRNFIVMDSIDNFLSSGYAYSVAGHDAYLDVTHEPLKISDQGFVMIPDEKYDEVMSDPAIAEELSKRKVVRFKGDETIAINMMLTANGALPTRIGSRYAHYDNEMNEIIENSFKSLAEEHGIAYDQSHGGALAPEGGGHFSNYYDEKNTDSNHAMGQVIEFLKSKFPEQADLFTASSIADRSRAQDIIAKLGARNLLEAINEYNEIARSDMDKKFETYREERESITSEEHDKFVSTVKAVNAFYQTPEATSRADVESVIKKFFQGKSKHEQLEAADQVLTMLEVAVSVLPNVDRQVLREARHVETQEHAKDTRSSIEYGE